MLCVRAPIGAGYLEPGFWPGKPHLRMKTGFVGSLKS